MATYEPPSTGVAQYCEQRGFSSSVREGGFGYLLDLWTMIVDEIEAGYRCLFDEYLNDMDVREIIDELQPYAISEERVRVEKMLPSLDRRFNAVTRRAEVCVWGRTERGDIWLRR